MHYYLYEIRNNINGKIYIGVHKTKVLDDGYMGSGKLIKAVIEKYGLENFTKTILETFETQEEMFAKEKEVVNEEFLTREDTYNLCRGGLGGGFDFINSNKDEAYASRRLGGLRSIEKHGSPLIRWMMESSSEEKSEKQKKSVRLRKENGTYVNDSFTGKTHTEETKRSIGNANSIHQTGTGNSQYGTMWITDGLIDKKIKKDEIIPEGWNKGRKQNNCVSKL